MCNARPGSRCAGDTKRVLKAKAKAHEATKAECDKAHSDLHGAMNAAMLQVRTTTADFADRREAEDAIVGFGDLRRDCNEAVMRLTMAERAVVNTQRRLDHATRSGADADTMAALTRAADNARMDVRDAQQDMVTTQEKYEKAKKSIIDCSPDAKSGREAFRKVEKAWADRDAAVGKRQDLNRQHRQAMVAYLSTPGSRKDASVQAPPYLMTEAEEARTEGVIGDRALKAAESDPSPEVHQVAQSYVHAAREFDAAQTKREQAERAMMRGSGGPMFTSSGPNKKAVRLTRELEEARVQYQVAKRRRDAARSAFLATDAGAEALLKRQTELVRQGGGSATRSAINYVNRALMEHGHSPEVTPEPASN